MHAATACFLHLLSNFPVSTELNWVVVIITVFFFLSFVSPFLCLKWTQCHSDPVTQSTHIKSLHFPALPSLHNREFYSHLLLKTLGLSHRHWQSYLTLCRAQENASIAHINCPKSTHTTSMSVLLLSPMNTNMFVLGYFFLFHHCSQNTTMKPLDQPQHSSTIKSAKKHRHNFHYRTYSTTVPWSMWHFTHGWDMARRTEVFGRTVSGTCTTNTELHPRWKKKMKKCRWHSKVSVTHQTFTPKLWQTLYNKS